VVSISLQFDCGVIGVAATCLSIMAIPVPFELRSLNRNKKRSVDPLPVEPGPNTSQSACDTRVLGGNSVTVNRPSRALLSNKL
jgi:hypothetical protein